MRFSGADEKFRSQLFFISAFSNEENKSTRLTTIGGLKILYIINILNFWAT